MEIFVETKNGSETIEKIIRLRKDDTLSTNGRVYWKTVSENGNNENLKINFVEYPLGAIEKIDFDKEFIKTSPKLIEDQIKEKLVNVVVYKQNSSEGKESIIETGKKNYDPIKIKIRTRDWPVGLMSEYIDKGDIDLHPNFQRKFVWDGLRKSRLIESLMLGIPIPAFYFAENEEGKYLIVDGFQRMFTIHSFLKNEFSLSHLEYLSEFEGYYFKDDELLKKKGLLPVHTRRILYTTINVNIIDEDSHPDVKFEVFKRLNMKENY